MTSERDQWTATFGLALVGHVGSNFRVESGRAWRYGRFLVHINPENGEASLISIFAMEEPNEGRGNGASTNSTEFEYYLENDPFVAAQMVIRWVGSH